MTLRSAFYPLLGEAIRGRWGHLIDTLAVVATLFGLATSLGLGAEQTAAGLAHLFGAPASTTTKVLLIAGITGTALASVVIGIRVARVTFEMQRPFRWLWGIAGTLSHAAGQFDLQWVRPDLWTLAHSRIEFDVKVLFGMKSIRRRVRSELVESQVLEAETP